MYVAFQLIDLLIKFQELKRLVGESTDIVFADAHKEHVGEG